MAERTIDLSEADESMDLQPDPPIDLVRSANVSAGDGGLATARTDAER